MWYGILNFVGQVLTLKLLIQSSCDHFLNDRTHREEGLMPKFNSPN